MRKENGYAGIRKFVIAPALSGSAKGDRRTPVDVLNR